LVLGVCNPRGEGATYNGLYLKQDEIEHKVRSGELNGVPVKAEHAVAPVGRIVSTLLGADGALQCVLELDEASIPGSLSRGFVRDGIATELSLGYTVDVQNSKDAQGTRLQAGAKQVLEVSLVRKGARDGCYITAYEEGGVTVFRSPPSCWDAFDLS